MKLGRLEFLGVRVYVVLTRRFKNVGYELAWCVVRACMARHGADDRSSLAQGGVQACHQPMAFTWPSGPLTRLTKLA